MQERYRKDYDGEFVILNTTFKNGKKTQDREWVENPIENQYISARAAIIGNGFSREKFDIKKIENHKGGLLGKKSLQIYGSAGCWNELRCDFYVEHDANQLEQIIETGYVERSTVYTDVYNCITYPGEFYLIPYNVKLYPTATAIYIAAFDGHTEIFLIGADATDASYIFRQNEANSTCRVINTYKSTTFYFVSDYAVPDCFKSLPNTKIITYREFISYCDV